MIIELLNYNSSHKGKYKISNTHVYFIYRIYIFCYFFLNVEKIIGCIILFVFIFTYISWSLLATIISQDLRQ